VSRKDKVNAVKRYLTAQSGIPLISWDGVSNRLDAPPPYAFCISTDLAGSRFFQNVNALSTEMIDVLIRYDAYIDNVDKAVVAMPLRTFTKLLIPHYEQARPRVNTFIEGD